MQVRESRTAGCRLVVVGLCLLVGLTGCLGRRDDPPTGLLEPLPPGDVEDVEPGTVEPLTPLPLVPASTPTAPAGGRPAWKPKAIADRSLPTEISLESLLAGDFHLTRRIPPLPRRKPDRHGPGPLDLARGLKNLVQRELDGPQKRFADLVRPFRATRDNPHATKRLLDSMAKSNPDLLEAIGPWLTQLVRCDWLLDRKWTPTKTESGWGLVNDGILEVDTITVRGSEDYPPPWNREGLTRVIFQTAAVIFADLETIQEVDMDFRSQTAWRGLKTTDAYLLDGRYFRGRDERDLPFVAWSAFYDKQIGFPWGELAYVIDGIDRFDEEGYPITEIWATDQQFTDRKHFEWLAARDTYIPLVASDGSFIGTLVVNQMGFALAAMLNVDSARRDATRTRLGNLKREAESRTGL